MKRLPFLILLAACALAQTSGLRSVYIMPMASGFDQYLAEQISRDHVMQVVADPKMADTVLTDRLGAGFEAKMAEVRPATGDPVDSNAIHPSFRSNNGGGTIFLVDATSRRVLWSNYQKMARSSTPGVMNREASRVTKKLAIFANPGPNPKP